MPEWNPDQSPSGLLATDYALHLWRRRWILFGASFLVLVLCYLGIRLFHKNQYEARALVMVRQQPRITNVESDRPGIRPPTFRRIFTADENIRFVVNQYNDGVESGRWADDPGAHVVKTPLEKLRPLFRAESAANIDTTVATEFSPVIELRTRGFSPGMARTFMDLWLSRILDQYGNLLTDEAEYLAEAARARSMELEQELMGVEARREALDSRLALADARRAGLSRALTSASIPPRREMLGNEVVALGMFSGGRDANLVIQGERTGVEPGLLERRTALRMELAEARADGEGSRALRLEARLADIDEEIAAIESEIVALGEETGGIAAQRAQVAAEQTRLEYAIRIVASQASQAEGQRRRLVEDPEGWHAANYSTLRVLTGPVVPNERVWPQRTLLAGIIALGVFVLLAIAFCGELYLRRAVVLGRERRQITA